MAGIKRTEDCGCVTNESFSPVASAALISHHGVEVMSASKDRVSMTSDGGGETSQEKITEVM